MQQQQHLPPLPKLRPRPGFQPRHDPLAPHRKERSNGHSNNTPDLPALQPPTEEETTSRLLMKSECKGAGRKKSSGSLVHSIPKFSQVKPNGRLTEVQKVLQSRIISKQQRQQQQQQQVEHQRLQQQVEQQRLQQQQYAPQPKFQSFNDTSPFTPSRQKTPVNSGLRASDLLQNIISLHEQSRTPNPTPRTQTPPSSIAPPTNHKRRGRKPAKEEICHVVKTPSRDSSEEHETEPPPEVTIQRVEDPRRTFQPPPFLPVLSEVTITPAKPTIPSQQSSRRCMDDLDRALDLRKDRPRSPSPEVLEVIPRPMLHPHEYERARMPPGYVYCAGANVFVHHTSLPSQYVDPQIYAHQPGFMHGPPQGFHPKASRPRMNDVRSRRSPESQESMQSVMRVRPQKPVEGRGGKGVEEERYAKRRRTAFPYQSSDVNNEVSICKFKFTGGAKPTLEEKKMLSVDSGGNLRYFSGSGDRTLRGFEHLPPDMISRAGASVVTDRFTAITADRMLAKAGNSNGGKGGKAGSSNVKKADKGGRSRSDVSVAMMSGAKSSGRKASLDPAEVIREFDRLPDDERIKEDLDNGNTD